MPQKDMVVVDKPAAGKVVLEPAPGSAALRGSGDLTYRCGSCKTRLLDRVTHQDVFHGEPFDAVKCPKCGRYNALSPEELAHHHHH
jgi:phage FluMu protein Com